MASLVNSVESWWREYHHSHSNFQKTEENNFPVSHEFNVALILKPNKNSEEKIGDQHAS